VSGQPIPGIAGAGAFGLLKSGALEDSNVDLSEELVDLIVAQRNFQANAKTIETNTAITQTVINLRS
jgi:flagellar hook protein FlgE